MKDEIKNIVELKSVSKFYKVNNHTSVGVSNISFKAERGELVLFLGPSGSGKTTLLTLIAGLLEPTLGAVIIFDREVNSYSKIELQKLRAQSIGFIFQTFFLIDALTARENVELVLGFASKKGSDTRKISDEILQKLSIGYLANKLPQNMSQGEKQRVAVARAIANDADLILADEPTASLDTASGSLVVELLSNYCREKNKCVIVVSHDLRLKEYADRIIYLKDGIIVN